LFEYPFSFPNYFFLDKGKYDREVKFEFVKSMSNINMEKNFSVKSFFNKFSVSNKNRTKIKKLIISGFSVLIDKELIESTYSFRNWKD
jgi:hypothetical protein